MMTAGEFFFGSIELCRMVAITKPESKDSSMSPVMCRFLELVISSLAVSQDSGAANGFFGRAGMHVSIDALMERRFGACKDL